MKKNDTTTHLTDNGHALCRKNISKGLTTKTEEVTCLDCIGKMHTKPRWYVENKKAEQWNNRVSMLNLRHTPKKPEALVFEAGEEVEWGGFKFAKILEVYDDGQYYKITTSKDGNDESIRAVTWLDIFKLSTHQSEMVSKKVEDYGLHYRNTSISSLATQAFFFGVELNPDYQRDYVWSIEDKVALIDSIFKGLEIGRLLFVKLPFIGNDCGSEIVDGKQRFSTIVDFMSGKFKYMGKYYYEMHPADRTRFEETTIVYGELPEDITREQLLSIFIETNTKGRVMEQSHLDKIIEMRDELRKEMV